MEIEIKLPFEGGAAKARELVERSGYGLIEARTLESDLVLDLESGRLRRAGELLRLRRSGARSFLTYKGPAARAKHKTREEIEVEISAADTIESLLHRLGFAPAFRYAKYRTKFQAPGEPGIVTIDETPIGIFLELEGPPAWIDRTAKRLGFSPEQYSTASYGTLYREYRMRHPKAPADMIFGSVHSA